MGKILVWFPALAVFAISTYFATTASSQITPATQTKAVVTATSAFLNSLSAEQCEKLLFPFTAEETATAANRENGRRARTPVLEGTVRADPVEFRAATVKAQVAGTAGGWVWDLVVALSENNTEKQFGRTTLSATYRDRG